MRRAGRRLHITFTGPHVERATPCGDGGENRL